MKKILSILIIIMSIAWIEFVYAEDENKLYFNDNGDRLYYNSKLLDSDSFMNFVDMVPGKTYDDMMIIKNESENIDCTLYFQVKEVENTELANELLDNLDMKIYLDDELIYEGSIRGESYALNGTDLKDAVKLGVFKKGEEHKLAVETTLDYEYDNIENYDTATIDWVFYGEYNDNIYPIIPLPNTSDKIVSIITLFAISVVVIVLIIYMMKHEKKFNN